MAELMEATHVEQVSRIRRERQNGSSDLHDRILSQRLFPLPNQLPQVRIDIRSARNEATNVRYRNHLRGWQMGRLQERLKRYSVGGDERARQTERALSSFSTVSHLEVVRVPVEPYEVVLLGDSMLHLVIDCS